MRNRNKKSGFTMVELLTTIVIIAILTSLLIPALSMVRNTAREARQKAQFTNIDLAIMAFKNDNGDYPRSSMDTFGIGNYGGLQKLAEALVGWDLMGFHPQSAWRPDGYSDASNGDRSYDPDKNRVAPGQPPATLNERRGLYLDMATSNVYRLRNISQAKPGLFNNTGLLAPDTYVICDSFASNNRKITIGDNIYKPGMPILYYKANTSSKDFSALNMPNVNIYNTADNLDFLAALELDDPRRDDPLFECSGFVGGSYFYSDKYKVLDPKVNSRPWPHRPDSYILISAGVDGKYGTNDDITNFGR